MKHIILSLTLLVLTRFVFAQKPPVDTSLFAKWPEVDQVQISADGKYVSYKAHALNHHNPVTNSLIVQATEGSYRVEIPIFRYNSPAVMGDFKYAVFKKNGDSLGMFPLGGTAISYIEHVGSFAHAGKSGNEWLIYTLKDDSHSLIISNLTNKEEKRITGVLNYHVNKQGNTLIIVSGLHRDSLETLYQANLQQGIKPEKLWSGYHISDIVFNEEGSQFVFLGADPFTQNGSKTIRAAGRNSRSADILFNDASWPLRNEWEIAGIREFGKGPGQLLLSLSRKKATTQVKQSIVKIWSYADARLLSQQLAEKNDHPTFAALLNINSKSIIPAENETQRMMSWSGSYALVEVIPEKFDSYEWHWNPACKREFYLLSLQDGTKKFLFSWNYQIAPLLDPQGKYIVYYDPLDANYYSYNIASSEKRNITGAAKQRWIVYGQEGSDSAYVPIDLLGWVPEKNAALLQDQFDIWQIDLAGIKSPLNLTNGFGRSNNITFQPSGRWHETVFKPGQELILTAFNRKTKDNGYYSIHIGLVKDPEKRTMGPFAYQLKDPSIQGDEIYNESPVKASGCSCYVIKRMSETHYPNYYFTKDFRTFTPLSNFQPHKNYNWLTAELVEWAYGDGKTSQGILYKPEDFDPSKKYPLIIHYYERLSDGLHSFRQLGAAEGNINVPWMVSHGYLVFNPDIHYQPGKPGESAYKAIVSAAQFLGAKPWVDKDHIGIQGHSFGGYETNYVVTHSNLFAAACSAAGIFDIMLQYGDTWGYNGSSMQPHAEHGQFLLEGTPWNKQSAYIENSPVFSVDKVTTPILLMHNKKDQNVNYLHGLGFFLDLRRLQKKAWLLEYTKSDHIIDEPEEALDFNTRLTQFFDHYLKGAPMPDWMK